MTLPDVAQRKLQQLSQQASDAMALRDAAKKQTGDVEAPGAVVDQQQGERGSMLQRRWRQLRRASGLAAVPLSRMAGT